MLVSLIVALILVALCYWLITVLPLPPIVRQIAVVVLVIVAVLYLIGALTGRHFVPGL